MSPPTVLLRPLLTYYNFFLAPKRNYKCGIAVNCLLLYIYYTAFRQVTAKRKGRGEVWRGGAQPPLHLFTMQKYCIVWLGRAHLRLPTYLYGPYWWNDYGIAPLFFKGSAFGALGLCPQHYSAKIGDFEVFNNSSKLFIW